MTPKESAREDFAEKTCQLEIIAREIENTPYGCRDFDVKDNSGYILCFGQVLDA